MLRGSWVGTLKNVPHENNIRRYIVNCESPEGACWNRVSHCARLRSAEDLRALHVVCMLCYLLNFAVFIVLTVCLSVVYFVYDFIINR